jgi:hypothetical protein
MTRNAPTSKAAPATRSARRKRNGRTSPIVRVSARDPAESSPVMAAPNWLTSGRRSTPSGSRRAANRASNRPGDHRRSPPVDQVMAWPRSKPRWQSFRRVGLEFRRDPSPPDPCERPTASPGESPQQAITPAATGCPPNLSVEQFLARSGRASLPRKPVRPAHAVVLRGIARRKQRQGLDTRCSTRGLRSDSSSISAFSALRIGHTSLRAA